MGDKTLLPCLEAGVSELLRRGLRVAQHHSTLYPALAGTFALPRLDNIVTGIIE